MEFPVFPLESEKIARFQDGLENGDNSACPSRNTDPLCALVDGAESSCPTRRFLTSLESAYKQDKNYTDVHSRNHSHEKGQWPNESGFTPAL